LKKKLFNESECQLTSFSQKIKFYHEINIKG